MPFKSFLSPHEEGSEADEGPVNITKYKCAIKHNFGWIFAINQMFSVMKLLILGWYNSSCHPRDPRENKQFIPYLKSQRSCEKKMCHRNVVLTDELLLPGHQIGCGKGSQRGLSQHTNVVTKYHLQ